MIEKLKIVNELVEIGGGEVDSDCDDNIMRIMCSDYQIWFDMNKMQISIETLREDSLYVTITVDEENYIKAANYLKYKA